jgi:type I restriction enzyme M protein
MLGAIIGDIVGSRFEFNNYRHKDFELFHKDCFATDDSIMTLAVAQTLLEIHMPTGKWDAFEHKRFIHELGFYTAKNMQSLGRPYPACGFGGQFYQWIYSENPKAYNSFGNGAAMRISPVGFFSGTEQEVKDFSRAVTEISHNHPEGIKGAEATALAIFLARKGLTKTEIRARIVEDYYPIDFTIEEIRPTYRFNETCQDTVPQALACFFESRDFEDSIRTAISLGGDSDTLAAIAGGIAEAYYGLPEWIERKAVTYLDERLRKVYENWQKNKEWIKTRIDLETT